MCSRVLIFLTGAVFIYCQVIAADIYFAELMVESNVTLDAQTLLSVLNATTSLQVTDALGVAYTVTLLQNELEAECIIIGTETTCNCSAGYTWSNEVCYNYSCCTQATCTANVSYVSPICVPIVNVRIFGSVILASGVWDATKTTVLQNSFSVLNGFQYLNITAQRLGNSAADFEAGVITKCDTPRLQNIVTSLETILTAVVWVNTLGMVIIMSPNSTVCYQSIAVFQCNFEETTDSAGWNMSTMGKRNELNNGSVVKLDLGCVVPGYNSCIGLTLQVTGAWAGIYECGFTKGSVRHTAMVPLNVALLPDVITIVASPPTGDCSAKMATDIISINITTTITQSTETYDVWWSYRDVWKSTLYSTPYFDSLIYTFNAPLSCQATPNAHYVNITFKNTKGQQKTSRLDIPVVYAGNIFCSEDVTTGQLWPKTPAGDTVINRTCDDGRVGYRSRTCIGPAWQPVFDYCVNQQLNNVLNQADNFLKGLGATQDKALTIFEGLYNSSALASTDNIADIGASVNVLNFMSRASSYFTLEEAVLPDFIDAASNILNKTWNAVNETVLYNISSTYLDSVESLVKNINVNITNDGVISPNLDLKFCSSDECNVSVFDVNVFMNKTDGLLKTLVVKNLMHKLRNSYSNTVPTSLLLSATLQDNNDSCLDISLEFPKELSNMTKSLCVFWNTQTKDWSTAGCIVNNLNGNYTQCKCSHLTSFSVLMAKGEIPFYSGILDTITNVGLGVSIASLLIFLFIESLVWSAVVKTNLSYFRHTSLVNIATFLLLADTCFLASTSPGSLTDTWCLVLTICKHLFFLAMFCWMLCLSVMLVHQLIFVFNPLRKKVFMFLSSIVGYVFPILIVGSSYMYYKYTQAPYYNNKTCWLVFDRILVGSMHAFLIPVGTITLTNLFCMIVVIVTLLKTSVPDSNKADKEAAKSVLKVVVILTPVFGVTWIIGFFQLMLGQDNPMYATIAFIFTIFNSFQGLFILITGCFAEPRVREELFKVIRAKMGGKSDSTKNLTSTTYTKDK